MTDGAVGLVGGAVLALLLLLRVPVGSALLIVGMGGIGALHPGGVSVALPLVAQETFTVASAYLLCLLPLLALFGQLVSLAGLTSDPYRFSRTVALRSGAMAHARGWPVAAFVGSAASAALAGSAVVAVATHGKEMLRDMRQAGLSDGVACESIAAGAAAGTLLAPAALLVVYALMTGQSIELLYLGALVPGVLLLAALLALLPVLGAGADVASPSASLGSNIDSAAAAVDRSQVHAALIGIVLIIGLAAIVIAGVRANWFDLVQALAGATVFVLAIALYRGHCRRRLLVDALVQTLRTSASTFWLLIGASSFASFMAFSGLPADFANWVVAGNFAPVGVVLGIVVLLFILGSIVDGLTAVVLVMPLVQPALEVVGVDLLWFGVLVLLSLEATMLLPPFGLLIFILKALLPEVGVGIISRAIGPVCLAIVVGLLALIAFPDLVTWLPASMATGTG